MSVITSPPEPTRAALERELALSRELAAIIGEAASLEAALRECLERSGSAMSWELGQAWMASSDAAETLRCRGTWASEPHLEPFLITSPTLHLDLHTGLPGRVWTSGEPVWVEDIQASGLVRRKEAAARAGLRSAAAVPVLAGGHPVAVLEFYTSERREEDAESIRLLSEVAGHIGPMVGLKEAQQLVRQRETQLAEAQALAKLGSWEWDRHTGEEHWSAEMFRIYGVAPQRLAPANRRIEYQQPDDRRALRTQWQRTVKDGRPFSLFHRIVRADGGEVTLHVQGKPSIDGDGNVVGITGTTQDVTEQLRLKEERQQAEQRFRGAFENAPIGMTIDLPDGRFAQVNEAFCRMTGYPREVLEGKSFHDITHPDDVEACARSLDQLMRGERSVHIEKRYRHADGRWIVARVSISVILDAEGQPSLFIAQIEDVSAARRAERELNESRERLQAILDNAPMAVHMKDLDGRYILVNRMAASLAGLEREQFIGKSASDLLVAEPAIDFFVAGDQGSDSKDPISIEHEIETPDGVRTLLTKKFHVRDSEGEIYAVADVSLDITDRVRADGENRRLESELQKARRLEAVGGLAGGIAHDFNNLLAVIINYVVLAREEVSDAAPIAEELDEIRRAADRAADLTHKLLVFSRQEHLEPQVLDLNSVVVDAEWLLRRTLGEHIELYVELGEDLCPVEGDAAQLEGILINLAVNARDAMADGGTLSVRTENVIFDGAGPPTMAPGRYISLSVTDDGSGMSEEVAARAFDPFFTTKPTGEGTGLGLATVHGIARQAGGTVELRSRAGGGTTVTTYLPASERKLTPAPPQPSPETVKGNGEAILVVEDEPSVRRMIGCIVTRAGYSIREVSPMEALEACASPDTPVDLLLTDVVMPHISGAELAARARELCPELKVLFMSGYVDEAKLESKIHKLVPFLQKPFAPEGLLQAVEHALEREPPRS